MRPAWSWISSVSASGDASSTWTYLVDDDPFRDQIGMLLTGPGRTSVAIYAAVMMIPLLLVWGLLD